VKGNSHVVVHPACCKVQQEEVTVSDSVEKEVGEPVSLNLGMPSDAVYVVPGPRLRLVLKYKVEVK